MIRKSLELEAQEKKAYQEHLTTLHRYALMYEMYQTKQRRELAKYRLARQLFFEHFYPFLNDEEAFEIYAYDQLLQSGFLRIKGEEKFRRVIDVDVELIRLHVVASLEKTDQRVTITYQELKEKIETWKQKIKE